MIRITKTQLLNFTLQKNFLAVSKAPDLATYLNACLALPAEDPLSPFLAAHLRLADFTPQNLSHARDQVRQLCYTPLMRGEAHLVGLEDLSWLHAATQRQIKRSFNVEWINWQVTVDEIDALGEKILTLLSEEPATLEDLERRLGNDLVQTLTYTTRGGHVKTISNVALALQWLWAMKKVLLGWIDISDIRLGEAIRCYTKSGLPGLTLDAMPSEAEAQTRLVKAYLAAFGPATEADIDFWTGFSKGERARATGKLFRDLTQVLVEGMPGTMFLLKGQAEALRETSTEAKFTSIHFLPQDDNFIKAYKASRARFLANPKMQGRIFKGSGEVVPSILIQGQIMGTWGWDEGEVKWRLFEEVETEVLRGVEAEARRVQAFIIITHDISLT